MNAMDNKQTDGRAHRSRRGRKTLTIIGIVVLVLLAMVIAYTLWERPPEVVTPTTTSTPAPTVLPSKAPDDPVTPTDPPQEADPEEDKDADALATDRDSGKYTILLVGRDFASNSTDTLIVARMDTKAHSIDCVSIPRDLLINISWGSTPKKINAVYPGYSNSGKDPVEGIKTHIKNLLGFEVDCYSIVNIEAMEEAVDTIGGVWFDVPQDMYYWDPTQDLLIDLKKGYQLLNGEDAVKLCRFRYGYTNNSDIERIGTQQAFLKTLASQMLSLGNIPNLGTLVNILVENVDTDLTAANLAWFARQFLACKMDDIHFYTLPYSTAPYINGISYVSVDQNAWLEMVNSCLNPYVEPVTAANMNLLMSNASGSNVWSTTGAVAGGADSFFCTECTVKNGGKAVHHLPGSHLSFDE